MKNENKLGVYMRGAFFIGGLVFGLSSVVVAEPINPEQLNHSYCRNCTEQMWLEVLPYLPRRDDGSLQQPIDDSTVMDVYRRLWNESKGRTDICLNSWAADRVGILVKNQLTIRALNKCQKKIR